MMEIETHKMNRVAYKAKYQFWKITAIIAIWMCVLLSFMLVVEVNK